MRSKIKAMTNKEAEFYLYLGRIFGSRKVESTTGDRFYDDDEKVWYIHFSSNSEPDAYVSAKNSVIKNVYAPEAKNLIPVLKELLPRINISIVPAVYKKEFELAGYLMLGQHSKNFIKVRGMMNE